MKLSFSTFVLLLQAIGSSQGDSGAFRSASDRRLSYELISTYEPYSLVTDHAAIDLDLHLMKQQLAWGTSTSYKIAERIYQEGAHSKPVAELELTEFLDQPLLKGTEIIGTAAEGGFYSIVKGRVLEDVDEDEWIVKIQYDVNEIQESYVHCQVGAHPQPNTKGCFAAQGTLNLPDSTSYNYTYDILRGNLNFRTIQGFSVEARDKMFECATCPYSDYKKFVDYYGRFEYADRMVMAAFRKEETDLMQGNMDFGVYSESGLTEVIEKAIVYLNIWMYAVREMEDAIDDCNSKCTSETCNDDPDVHSWDEAVAFYTGSRNAKSNNNGNLLFSLADKRCMQTKTCGENGGEFEGKAKINYEIFGHFKAGQQHLLKGNCEGARKTKERIVSLMTVPLIQGTLRYAHIMAGEKYNEKHSAQGTVFAMSVLPMVHACKKEDAKIIYENLKARAEPKVDYAAVQGALQRNYKCMNIKCSEVSGIHNDVTGTWFQDAKPCRDGGQSSPLLNDDQQDKARAIGLTLVGVLGCVMFVCLIARRNQGKELDTADPPTTSPKNVPETDDSLRMLELEEEGHSIFPSHWTKDGTGEEAAVDKVDHGEML